MSREEIEALLTRKYDAGEAEVGLYNTGLQYVYLDSVDGQLVFQWFQNAMEISDLL